ncbi:hypothetical protein LTS15_001757 [Exophiala xenobiotica]|nr:hypothetical protein LTS15_001757 [Exophiala xenobiotica]
MPYSLKGRNVLVTGGSRGLGAVICEKFAAEGSNVMINYVSSKDKAEEVAGKCKNDFGVKVAIVQGDVGVAVDCVRLVKESAQQLGGLDIIVNNAGWTRFAKFGDLNDLSHEEWDKCWRTNVMSQLCLMQEAVPIFNANPEGGVFLVCSSVATHYVELSKGISCAGSSLGYSVTKASGLHLMKCMASTQGPKIRINAILPGLLLTDWTYLDDCADSFVSTAKNTSMTGQQIVVGVDAGLVIR